MNKPQPYLNEVVKKDLNDLEIEAQLTKVMTENKPSNGERLVE